jgi:hypothetical protein
MEWMLLGDGAAGCPQAGMHETFSLPEQEALLAAELQAQRDEHFQQMHMMESYMHSLGMASPQHLMWCESETVGMDVMNACREAEYCMAPNSEIQPLQPGVAQRVGCTEIELME